MLHRTPRVICNMIKRGEPDAVKLEEIPEEENYPETCELKYPKVAKALYTSRILIIIVKKNIGRLQMITLNIKNKGLRSTQENGNKLDTLYMIK